MVFPQLTFIPGELVPAGGVMAVWTPDRDNSDEVAATAARTLGFPAGDPGTMASVEIVAGELAAAERPVRLIAVLPAVRRLAEMPPGEDWPSWSRPAASVLGWSAAAKLALELVAAGRILPTFRATEDPTVGRAHWRVAAAGDGRVRQLANAFPLAAHALLQPSGALWGAEDLLVAFLDAVADACAREGRRPELDPRRRGPRQAWPQMWAEALQGVDPTVAHLRVSPDDLAAEVEEWAAPLLGRDRQAVARLAVRLLPPAADPDDNIAVDVPWRLVYLLQSTRDPTVRHDAAEVWDRAADRPFMLGELRVDDPETVLVRGLGAAARLFEPIDRSLSETHPTGVDLTGDEAAALLSGGADALAAGGIGVEVPPELKRADEQRLRLRVRIGQRTAGAPRVEGATPLGLRDITDLAYEIVLGDDALTPEEFAQIVQRKQSLVRWRGLWVRVDQDEVDQLAALAGTTASLELTEALAAALSGQAYVEDVGWVETVADGDLGALLERLRHADAPGAARIERFRGELRPYQRRGVAWLQRLSELKLGGVLADQMGLGKTIMAIAVLAARTPDRPHLVVCPTSVVGNWERELARFAPDVPVVRHHGPDRPVTWRAFKPGLVVVTSYAVLRRDIGMLEDVDWDVVVLDEAQQIKNPASKGARAARTLTARMRIAMTGTPIENRLSELWAIIDVTNSGLLGSQRAFNSRFAAPIERWHDEHAAGRLRRLVAPFVLRRLKTDPEVAVDLPPKQEITVTCGLTREQASLYQAAIEEAFTGPGFGATAFERRGRILALLTALKQICNHPAQYLRDAGDPGTGRLVGRSGKLVRTTEILAELVDGGERALVFTQFREMGALLARHLASELDLPEAPFLHGGVPLPQRDRMVARFQEDDEAPPILLVSLRAGGTGLNLTRASHVLHYDRWWNPAVEDQATDRAHRIGQTRAVTVHTLVTAGTLEERIAELLDRKRALADRVVAAGETWLTELGDEQLRELVELSAAEVVVEDDGDNGTADAARAPGRPVLLPIPGGRS